MTPPIHSPRGARRCARAGLSLGAATALVLTLAGPAAVADTGDGVTSLGTAADLGVSVPGDAAELTSEFAASPTGAYFVEFAPRPTTQGGSTASVQRVQRDFVSEAQDAGIDLEVRHTFSSLWSGISADIDDADIERVADLPQVRAVYPVLPVAAPERPVSEPELRTALTMSGADVAQSELGFTGEGLKVGVIDTGVDYDHPDFGGAGVDGETPFPNDKVVAGYDFVGDDFNADSTSAGYQPVRFPDADPDDCGGHGTHVAGIVAADGDTAAGGVRGVAPDAQIGAYRVFGCEGSTESDIMVAAMERALADGMDVVNQSIGSAFSTWPQYPTAVASDNLVDAGVVMVASIGNSGASGTWSAGAPGVGEDVIGVASFDNVSVTANVVDIDGEQHPYFPATGSPEPPTEGSLPLTRLGDPGTPAARGCPDVPTSVAGQAVLIERGADPADSGCDASFYAKALRAQTAGAAAVLIYNNVPGLINPTVEGATPITIPVIAISQSAGLAADAAVLDGGATLTWTDEVGTTPNPTGGLISSFSSYGLAADLSLKPDIGAPGGNIYSTYPLEKEGGYATASGTSMAAPHVAGAAALLLQARPDLDAHEVRDILQNSADAAAWSGNATAGLLEPVHRQGAGMLDIDAAILATTTVTPGKLSLGESEGGPVTKNLTVTNDGDAAVTYDLSSTDALATAGNPDNPSFFGGAATVVMPDLVTVPAGESVTFPVTISPAASLELAQYGGYVVLTPQGEGEPLSVPFAGFAGDYQALPLLENLGNVDLPALATLTECDRLIGIDCTAGAEWDLAAANTFFSMADGDVPTVLIHLEHPAQSLTFTVFQAMPEGAAPNAATPGQAVARFEQHVGRDSGGFTAWTWDGTRSTTGTARSAVPDGRYVLEVRALSALGDPTNPAHVETWSTPAFVIDRDGDGQVPPLEPEQPVEPEQPAVPEYGFFLNDGWSPVAGHVFAYGRFTDEVLIGDWDGNGTDTITVRRGNEFHVNNAPRGGAADAVFVYGRPGEVVLVGDWDGDGTDTLAVRRGAEYHVKNSLSGGPADQVVVYGRAGDSVLVGDWDGDGADSFAVRRGATYHVKNSIAAGRADEVFTYGRPADVTLVGDWDGDGKDTFAVRRGAQYFVKNSLTAGQADFTRVYGRAGDEIFVGDWDGDGKDSLGIRRTP
ncbi:S8 family serine peptidase [Georgenia wutianyii]|uniref:S8 family serine peptidase n=1 Tax=Georgenia wutianyii TaxID=2585135 RepID=UPI001CB74015